MRVAVLGVGRVGHAIILDLAAGGEFRVTAVDVSEEALAAVRSVEGVSTVQADLSDPSAVERIAREHDLVVGAVPGALGFQTVRAALEADRDVVDISFFPEDALALEEPARRRGRTVLVDCGVAPGLSNLVLGHLDAELDRVLSFECLVGGLPVQRYWPFEYRAPFSPADVLEEYTRPARLRRDGKLLTLPALSEVELVDIPGVGTLEAFNTDGLRTLLATMDVPDMVEKTLRYPGHAERMRVFREVGLLDTEPVEVDGRPVVPRALTARILESAWAFREGEEDLTVMQIRVRGRRHGRVEEHRLHLLDRYDPETGISSMARTTGYTCTAMVRLLAREVYRRPGVSPPELVGGQEGCYHFVLAELNARGVRLHADVEISEHPSRNDVP